MACKAYDFCLFIALPDEIKVKNRLVSISHFEVNFFIVL